MSDRIAGVLLLALAVWYGLEARTFDAGLADPLGPALFPQLLAIPLGLLAIVPIVKPSPAVGWVMGVPLVKQIAAVVTLALYAYAVEPLGFIVATTVCVAALSMLLAASFAKGMAAGLGTALVLYAIFDMLFGLPLPAGPWLDWI